MEQLSIILLTLSFIENCTIALLTYSLLSIKPFTLKFFTFVLLVMFTSLIVRTFPVVPFVLILIGILVYVIYFFLIYRIPVYITAIAAGISIFIYFFVEGLITPVLLNEFGTTYQQLFTDNLLRFKFFTIQIIIMGLIIFLVRYFKINLKDYLEFFKFEDLKILSNDEIDFKREKRLSFTFILVFMFIILQGIFINVYLWSEKINAFFNIHSFFTSATFINILIILFNIILIYLFFVLLRTMQTERKNIIQRINEKNALRLDWEKRAQMHDRNHHLHMLYMLLQLNNVERAKEYLKGMVGEIQNIEARVKCGNQALNALIRSKMSRAKQLGVLVNLEVEKKLERMKIQDWELNRIIGNLIDNAIEAVEKVGSDNRVDIIISNFNNFNSFEVITHGIVISDKVEKNLFKKGYSSKEEKGHGLGLAICKELVDEYGGRINIEKDFKNVCTSFKVLLPSIVRKD